MTAWCVLDMTVIPWCGIIHTHNPSFASGGGESEDHTLQQTDSLLLKVLVKSGGVPPGIGIRFFLSPISTFCIERRLVPKSIWMLWFIQHFSYLSFLPPTIYPSIHDTSLLLPHTSNNSQIMV